MKAAAFFLAGLAVTASAQPAQSPDSPISFTLQSRPDFHLANDGSGKPLPAWSGVINRSSITSGQTSSFRRSIPSLDFPGPGYRLQSEKSR